MNILQEVLSLPTAPFHEEAVADHVKNFCKELHLPLRKDRFGNLLVHYKRGHTKQPVVFTSHMDHPGFEVLSAKSGKCEIGIMGRINLEQLAGARVVFKTQAGIVKGIVGKRPLKKKWMGKPVFGVACHPRKSGDLVDSRDSRLRGNDIVCKGDFGWHDLPGYKKKGDLIYTKAADNVASVALLIELLLTLKKKKAAADVTCVFTRAEEIGFGGCIALEGQRILSKKTPIIVLECSSARAANVTIGGGVVIRVGDKLSTFSPDVDCWIKAIANQLAAKDKDFQFQRALLSGGTCESSVWMLKGYRTGGLAFPLGNYHNDGDKTYVPEFISLKDHKWMMKLLMALVRADSVTKTFRNAGLPIARNYRLWGPKLLNR